MGDLGALTLLPIVLSVVAVVAAGIAALFGSKVQILRADLTDLRDDNNDLERRAGRHETARLEAEAKVLLLEADLAALGRVVRHDAEWVSVDAQIRVLVSDLAELRKALLPDRRLRERPPA